MKEVEMQKRREGVSCSLQPLFPNTRTEISIYVPNVRRYTCEETNGVRLMMTPTSLPFQFFFFFFPLSTYVSHRIIITAIPSLTFNLFVTLPSPSIYCFVCFSHFFSLFATKRVTRKRTLNKLSLKHSMLLSRVS